jgi:hypothetical protein
MTWRFKIQGVVIAVLVLGALALAVGGSWVDAYDLGWAW